MRSYFLIGLFFFSCAAYANAELEREKIALRIKPVGQVFVQDKLSSDNNVGGTVEKNEPGQVMYEQYCAVCHKDGLAGAPRFRNEQDWKPRLTKRTLDDLVMSSVKGLRAMPAKGTCIKCSDEDLKAAISYMLPRS